MKTKLLSSLAIFAVTAICQAAFATEPPKVKMTTKIPAEIMIPERVDSRIGTLTFEDGFPTEETANKIYDQLDFQRAVESVMNNELPDLYNIEMDPREQINITTDNA